MTYLLFTFECIKTFGHILCDLTVFIDVTLFNLNILIQEAWWLPCKQLLSIIHNPHQKFGIFAYFLLKFSCFSEVSYQYSSRS